MAGFDKIDLEQKTVEKKEKEPETPDMAKRAKRSIFSTRRKRVPPKNLGMILGIVVFVLILIVFFVVLPAKNAYSSAKRTIAQARVAEAALKSQNVDLASDELKKTKIDLEETQKYMGQMAFLHFVPIANWYYNDADHIMKAGDLGLETSVTLVESLKPYADVLGLKGQGSFAAGSASDRIKTAVLTMGKITPQIDSISESLNQIQTEIDGVNPAHYPTILFGPKIKTQLTQVRQLTDDASSFVEQAKPLIKVLPSLLGESEEKKYFILFQNDKELRPTGGFMTSYSIFNLDKGIISIEKQDDIYALDASLPSHPKAPAPILKYLPKVYTFNLRDSNLSPDFIESMKTFNSMYEDSSQHEDVDGIIALDTHVLVSTIKILDDQVTADGITFTTKEDSRCKCPQVIYELENNISRPVNYVKTDRKGLLGDLLQAIMNKALTSSPKVYWGPLFQSMLMQINQKHIMFYLFDQKAQDGIIALNAAGKIKPFDGDYLHINNANMGGQKSNLFTTETVDESYAVDNDGTITKTLTLKYKNTFPPSDCNLERGGLCLNAELRNWLRIYVPKGSKLISNVGSEVTMTTYDELGKTVFDGFLTVRPLGEKQFTITYKLPFKVKKGSDLPVMVQKQPGTDGTPYTIEVNGRQKESFDLYADKEFNLKL